MKKALADVEADKESGKPYDVKRRNKLMEKFNQAQASFMDQVTQLAKKISAK